MFHTLDEYRNKAREEKADKNKKRTTDSYTGGKSSGIAVENPDDWINKMKNFEDKEKFEKTKVKLKLELYKNGFILDDGEFRDKSEPHNKKFMEDLEKGYIPKELAKRGYTDLGIEMDDRRGENYIPPTEEDEGKFHAFKGLGISISEVNTQGLHIDKNATSDFDKTKPTCKVNIRLFNGEVDSEDFNLCQTLQDVINFVKIKSGSSNFSLLDGFPPRPLTDYDKTIQELNLEGSLLTQKIN